MGGLAGGVTFGLFLFMQSLISMGEAAIQDVKPSRVIEFVRLKRSPPEIEAERKPERHAPEEPPPPPDLQMSQVERPSVDSIALAASGPAIQVLQLDPKHRPLDGIQPKISADILVIIFGFRAVVAQPGHLRRQIRVIGDHHAAIAKAAQIF